MRRTLLTALVCALALSRGAWCASGATDPVHAGHAIAYDAEGETYYVAYAGVDGDQDAFVTTFDAYGDATGSGEYRVTSDAALQRRVGIARDDANARFLIAYDRDGGQVRLRIMNGDGTFVGSSVAASGATTGTARERPAVAVSDDGTAVIIAWEDDRSTYRTDVWGNVLTTAGGPLSGEFRMSAADQAAGSPDVAYMTGAGRFILVFVEPDVGEIGAALITQYGSGDGNPYTLHAGTAPAHPAVACDPASGEGLVVWEDSGDIVGLRLDAAAAAAGSSFTICAGAGTRSLPDVCWEATNEYWLVAWQSDNGSDTDIEGCVVPKTGTAIGAVRALAASTDDEHSPSIHAARAERGHAAVSYWNDAADAPCVSILGEPRVLVESTFLNLNELSMTVANDVRLQAPPASDVTINIACGSPGDLDVSPSQLLFTTANWMDPQQIALDPVEDSIDEGYGEAIDVVLSVDAASDPAYAALADITIDVNLREWTESSSSCGAHGVACVALLLAGVAALRRRRTPA